MMLVPVLSALLVLLPAAAAPPRVSGRLEGRSMLELASRYPRTRTDPEPTREARAHQDLEGPARDPGLKDRFIKHLTGPLYFNPKCRKHFNRLYHNTRDCTMPAYFKRCARLLIRLANSPRCTER